MYSNNCLSAVAKYHVFMLNIEILETKSTSTAPPPADTMTILTVRWP